MTQNFSFIQFPNYVMAAHTLVLLAAYNNFIFFFFIIG